tara:strand:- start:344 stop:484 length:141 start_codon:yes stop_codon:yes gene_type:complete
MDDVPMNTINLLGVLDKEIDKLETKHMDITAKTNDSMPLSTNVLPR